MPLAVPHQARARWHAERQAANAVVSGGGDTASPLALGGAGSPARQLAAASAEAVADGPSAGQAAGVSAVRSASGQSEVAQQPGSVAVGDVVASKPSPACASGKIRQPMFGGEGARDVSTADVVDTAVAAIAVAAAGTAGNSYG